jgi:hypothetical protein
MFGRSSDLGPFYGAASQDRAKHRLKHDPENRITLKAVEGVLRVGGYRSDPVQRM